MLHESVSIYTPQKSAMKSTRYFYSIILAFALFMTSAIGVIAQDMPVPEDNVEGSDVEISEEDESSLDEDMEPDSVAPGSHTETSDTLSSEAFTPNVSFNSLMSQNMRDMKNLQLTGKIDEDYAQLISKHHEGAIRMAELYLVSGTNDQLKQLAEKMINRKGEEYEKLLKFSDQYPANQPDSGSTSTLLEPMERMMARQNEREATQDMEKDFVSMMLDHHKSGIEMSELEIYTGTNEELKELAKVIKEEDQKEMEQLKKWQDQNVK